MVEQEVVHETKVSAAAADGRVVLVAGATGLVGREVLAALLADNSVAKVHCVGRSAPPLEHPKLLAHTVDFKQLGKLPPVQDVYIALGTTIKVAGSQAAFKAIDLDAVVNIARACHAQGASRIGVVSAMGADAKSSVFYNRIKGEMEQAVSAIGFESTVFVRPSLLAGQREKLNQALRLGERIGLVAASLLNPLIPANYQAVQASDVAAALVKAVKQSKPGITCLLSGALQGAAHAH